MDGRSGVAMKYVSNSRGVSGVARAEVEDDESLEGV
jgi:hypothetical protein